MSYFTHSADEAESAFYAAFEHLDIQLMESVWLDADDAYCIHPGGPVQEGFETVLKQWRFILQDASPPEMSYRVVQKSVNGNLAVHLVEEHIGAADQATLVLATNIYKNTAEGWRLMAHHASLPPNLTAAATGGLH